MAAAPAAAAAVVAGAPAPQIVLVDSAASLAQCRAHVLGLSVLAWDCEGVDLGRFGEVCLVQLATPAPRTVCYVLDLLSKDAARDILAFARTYVRPCGTSLRSSALISGFWVQFVPRV